MPKHCPICNASSSEVEFIGEFCAPCAGKRISDKVPSEATIARCKACDRIRIAGAYFKPTPEAMQKAISLSLKGCAFRILDIDRTCVTLELMNAAGHKAIAEKRINMSYTKVLCDKCRKKAGSYYEAVMQLRGNPERVEKLSIKLNAYLERHGAFIARTEENDNGRDLYVSDKGLAAAFIARGRIVAMASYTLYGLKNGKRVYRHTYSIRL